MVCPAISSTCGGYCLKSEAVVFLPEWCQVLFSPLPSLRAERGSFIFDRGLQRTRAGSAVDRLSLMSNQSSLDTLSACTLKPNKHSAPCAQVSDGGDGKQLLASLPAFGLLATINDRIRSGAIALDATQYEYLLALMGVPAQPLPTAVAASTAPHLSCAPSDRPDSVSLKFLVSTVKDVLPHFGDGFVEATLQTLGWDSAAAVDSLLSGNLPSAVARLDQAAEVNPFRVGLPDAGGVRGAAADVSVSIVGRQLSWGQVLDAEQHLPSAAALQQQMLPDTAKAKASKYAGVWTHVRTCLSCTVDRARTSSTHFLFGETACWADPHACGARVAHAIPTTQ